MRNKKAKDRKNTLLVAGFFMAVILLAGVAETDNPSFISAIVAAVSSIYIIAFAIMAYRNTKNKSW